MNYDEFLRNKIQMAPQSGFDIDQSEINPLLKPHQKDIVQWALRGGRRAIFASFGLGKCHGAGTKVLMADCTIKNVEYVRIGDQLMGDDGTPRNVLSLARGREQMYRITLKNGDSYTCNESHIMSLKVSSHYEKYQKGDIVNMSVHDYVCSKYSDAYLKNGLKHYKKPLNFAQQEVPFEPYLYGAWLGDGHQNALAWTINNEDAEIVAEIEKFASQKGLKIAVVDYDGKSNCKTYKLTRPCNMRGHHPHCDEFYFVKSSYWEDGKRIDKRYLKNSREIRLRVLAGIVDTDGNLIDKVFEVSTKWKGFRDDVMFLARSLGFSVTSNIKIVNGKTYWRIWISGDTHLIPCITRKKAGKREQIKNPLVYGFKIESLGIGDYYGFEIDGNHLYMLADFTVTHNTFMQCEIMRIIQLHAGGRTLIVCPLGVRQEFRRDGKKLGIDFAFVRRTEEVEISPATHFLTNYESIRDGRLDPNIFTAVSLDEASILRSFGSKTYQTFLPLFDGVKYKFVATATPAPNRYKELIHYAGYLGVMDTGLALTRFFQRDSTKANNLTLYPHKEKEFWLWLHSWAIFLNKPSELGYSDEGYDLPELKVIYHPVNASECEQIDRDGQYRLFPEAALGLAEAAKEKRESMAARVAKMKEILDADPESHYLLWHDLEEERRMIERAVPTAVSVYGTQDLEERERNVIAFSDGEFQYLATKPELSGSGCNFQRHCHKAIFLGIGYKFNDFIQSVHRIYRFLQEYPCEIHIIYSEAEQEVLQVLQNKWREYSELQGKMSELIKRHGLNSLGVDSLARTIGVERKSAKGTYYEVFNNDAVEEASRQPDESVHLIVTSVPFSNHYEYTPSYNDFGHTDNNDHFWRQMDYLTPELMRILSPGRLACIHVKDRVLFGNVTGAGIPTISPFHAEAIFHYQKHGFDYMGMITVVTDVVRENNQTYRLGWTEQCKDGTKMGVGSPEYILLFHKPQSDRTRGYADIPVHKTKQEYSRARWQVDAHAFWRSSGDRMITADDLKGYGPDEMSKVFKRYSLEHIYDYRAHVQIGEELESKGKLPATFMSIAPASHDPMVWDDVNRMLTLNGEQTRRGLQNHICPLQLDIVDRLIERYSNKGEVVYDPFAGLMTVPLRAVLLGRYGKGSELSAEIFRDGVRYLTLADTEKSIPTLFDVEEAVNA